MTAIEADDVESVVAAFAMADPRVTEDRSFARLLKKASSKGDGRLCAYVRISQFRGLDESAGDIGIVRQARDICQLAVDDGVRIGTWHIDNDVSASSGRPRPGYESAFAMLASGRATGLFAWDLVRLYRRGSELERLVELVESAPEELVVRTVKTGSNGIDLADPLGRMMARMMVWAAEMETFQQSSRQQASQRNRAQKGLWHGGTLPFGYRRRPGAPGHLDVVEEEAELVRWGAAAIVEGTPLSRVVAHFEASGVRPHRAEGWTRQVVRGLYMNDAVAGLRTHTPRRIRSRQPARGASTEVVEAVWDAIIPIEELERVRAVLHDPARGGGRGSRPPAKWWLGRALKCSVCGSKMKGKKRQHRSGKEMPPCYLCEKKGCVTTPVDLTEAWAREVALEAYRGTTALSALSRSDVEELSLIDSQRNEALDLLDKGSSVASVAEVLERLSARETAIRSRARALPGPSVGQDVEDWWDSLTVPEKAARFYDLGLDIVVSPVLVRGTRRADQDDPGFRLRARDTGE